VSVTTDGAPSMVGKKKGVVALIEKHMKENGIQEELVKFHCIIHQQALCAKSASLKEAMQVVLKAVNFIHFKGLNHRQFQEFLKELDAEYDDLLYFCEVRLLSRGAMLYCVYQGPKSEPVLEHEHGSMLETTHLDHKKIQMMNMSLRSLMSGRLVKHGD